MELNLLNLSGNNRIPHLFLIIIPLALSAFTHLWNPVGFPSIYVDEDHYLRRAINVLEGEGVQESSSTLNEYHPYDHPYFGQIFLAGAFSVIGYPDALNPIPGEKHTIEMLYLVPRILMGLLSIGDTFLIYKICERRYNRNIALVASILFAVMPLGWPLRRVLLESIQLPLLLSSILFALYSSNNKNNGLFISNRNGISILLSGMFLGLAIFTKIPALTFIPAVALLIYTNNKNNVEIAKFLGLWLVPVVLIPMTWPAYSIAVGEFDKFLEGVDWQSNRRYRSLLASINTLFQIDPILILLGIFGTIFVTIKKRDYFPLIWSLPLPLFLELLGYVQFYMLLHLMPIFCMVGAILIEDFSSRIKLRPKGHDRSFNSHIEQNHFHRTAKPYFIIVALIGIFGLTSTTILITTNLNSAHFSIYASIVGYLFSHVDSSENGGENGSENIIDNDSDQVTLIGGRVWTIQYYWIPKYVFDIDLRVFSYEDLRKSIQTEKVLLIMDERLGKEVSKNDTNKRIEQLKMLYNETNVNSTFVDEATYDPDTYPFTGLKEDRGPGKIQLRVKN